MPVSLTTSSAPQPLREVRLRLRRLYAMSPVGVVGGFFVGLANGAFGGLGVVFARDVGLSITGIALFMSASLVGGAPAQLLLGRFSDRTDRRKVRSRSARSLPSAESWLCSARPARAACCSGSTSASSPGRRGR